MGRRRGKLPPNWQVYGGKRGWAEARMMVWAGLLLGLLAFQALRLWPEAPIKPEYAVTAPPSPPNPYAEADRSRAILAAQEGSPRRLSAGFGGGTDGVRFSGAVQVIDGDTFEVNGMRVRIADIDTPEVNGRCASEIALAARATRRMRSLLMQGPFELHSLPDGRDTDRYGRKLRIVTRGGQSLGDVLVAEGLARTWTGRRQPWC